MINGYRNGIREQQGAYQISQRQGAGSCTFQRSRKWDRLAPSLGDWYCLNRQDPLWSPPLWPSSRFRLRWYSQSYISGEQPVFVRLDRASWESSRRLTQFKKKRKIDASRDSLHFFFILVSKGQGNCIFLLRSICADCWRLDCIFCWLDFNEDAHCFNQSLDDVPLSASRVDVSNNQPKIWRTYNSNLALHLVSADCTSNLKQGWEMAGSFLVFWRKASFTVYLVNPELIGVCVATTLLMTQYLRAARLHPDGSRMRLRIAGAVLLSLTNRKDFLGFWCPLFVEREREREKKTRVFRKFYKSGRGVTEPPYMKLSTGPLSFVVMISQQSPPFPYTIVCPRLECLSWLLPDRRSSLRRAEQANRPICYGENKRKDGGRPYVGVCPCFLPFLLSREASSVRKTPEGERQSRRTKFLSSPVLSYQL